MLWRCAAIDIYAAADDIIISIDAAAAYLFRRYYIFAA